MCSAVVLPAGGGTLELLMGIRIYNMLIFILRELYFNVVFTKKVIAGSRDIRVVDVIGRME
jgi:hypothetical protein